MPRRNGKSADAFRTISEVAEDVDVPQHVLRFWETKFAQIKPLKRGGGRRYYRPEDVDLIRRVRGWLYDDGYTIKGVQKLLREGAMSTPEAGELDETAPDSRTTPREDSDAPSGTALGPVGSVPADEPDATARAAIGAAIRELEAIRDRLRSQDE